MCTHGSLIGRISGTPCYNSISKSVIASLGVIILTFALVLLGGCGDSGSDSKTSKSALSRSMSRAVILGEYETRNVEVGQTVELEAGGGAQDGNSYSWELVSAPSGSGAVIADPTAPVTSFVPDLPGEYEVELVVGDQLGQSTSDTSLIVAMARDTESLNWGLRRKLNVGEDPGISVNNNGIVVEVDESPSAYDLWYRVGIIRGGFIEWGGSHKFETGVRPSVDINDQGVVVTTYTNRFETKVYYRVGTVNVEARTIDWGSERTVESGNRPAVAINNQGKVMVVYSEFTALSVDFSCEVNEDWCEIWNRVGDVNVSNSSISWGTERTKGHGLEPSVDLNDNGELIIVYEGYTTDRLYYRSGRISGRSWSQSNSGNYGRGEAPDVGINNSNRVVVVHEHENTVELYSSLGWLDAGGLHLKPHAPYEMRGQVPVVALNDDNQFIAMSDIGDISFLPTSYVIEHFTTDFMPGRNGATWMETTEPMHYKTLRDLMLPGTHDSAAYDLEIGDHTNAEWMHGPDWATPNCSDIDDDHWLKELLEEACLVTTGLPMETANYVAALTATAQEMTIREQLEHGIRYFDMRVTYRHPSIYPVKTGFYLYHGLVSESLHNVLAEIKWYLESVSSEFVIFNFSHLDTGSNSDNSEDFTSQENAALMELLVEELGEYIIARDGMHYDDLLSTPFGELVADGPRIVLIYEDLMGSGTEGEAGYKPPIDNEWNDYFWSGFSAGGYTNTINLDYQETGVSSEGARKGQRLRFDDYLARDSNKLFSLFQTLTANAEIIAQNGLAQAQGKAYKRTLRVMSQDVNHHLGRFLKESEPHFPNIVLVDFPEESDVVAHAIRIAAACNQQPITGEISADPAQLWAPNHKMVEVAVDIAALESANPGSFSAWVESVRVEEPAKHGDEDIYDDNGFEPDWEITDDLKVELRAERQGQARNRVYHIEVAASDCSGSYSFETTVNVAHDMGH